MSSSRTIVFVRGGGGGISAVIVVDNVCVCVRACGTGDVTGLRQGAVRQVWPGRGWARERAGERLGDAWHVNRRRRRRRAKSLRLIITYPRPGVLERFAGVLCTCVKSSYPRDTIQDTSSSSSSWFPNYYTPHYRLFHSNTPTPTTDDEFK